MSAAGLNSLTFGSAEMQSVLCDLTSLVKTVFLPFFFQNLFL